MKKLIIYLFPLAIFVLFSCSKGDDSNNDDSNFDEVAATEIIKSHPWKISYQIVNGVKTDIFTDRNDPYVINFSNNGTLEFANFEDFYFFETWEISNQKLIINEDVFSIDELNSNKLVFHATENGISHSYVFVDEGNADAFPAYIIGKTYKPIYQSNTIDGVEEVIEREDGHDFTQKINIQKSTITFTDTILYNISWDVFSESFIILSGNDNLDNNLLDNNCGYELKLKDNGDINVKTYYYYCNDPIRSSNSSLIESNIVLSEVDIWDYLEGPNWILVGVDKNDVAISNFSDMPLGTIWFFNSYTNMVEERISSTDTEIEYLPWEFKETPTNDNIRIDIMVSTFSKTFKVMKINFAELDLSTEIEGDIYTFKFEIEEYIN